VGQRGRTIRPGAGDRRRDVVGDPAENLGAVQSIEGGLAPESKMEGRAEPIDVAALVDVAGVPALLG
jgi:hypothetical protein